MINYRCKYLPQIVLSVFIFCTSSLIAKQADYAIINALVIDGTNTPAYQANVFIDEGKIIAIDKSKSLKGIDADSIIDANGRYLTPGFIDLHSHGSPLRQDEFKNFIAMGVTTVSLGQDGFSPDHEDLSTWITEVNQQGVWVNVAMFIGHGRLRKLAGVGPVAEVTESQTTKMTQLLKANMDVVFGLTTGLEYSPGMYAKEDELIALAKIVAANDKLIMSHMRNEDDDAIIESLDELIKQGEFARVHASHLKSVYGKGKQRAEEILARLYQARKSGVAITADVYPYTASYTGIAILFPAWAKTPAQFDEAIKTRRPELAEFIRNKVISRNGPEATLFGTEPYVGKTLAEVAKDMNKSFEDVLIDDIGPGGASAAYFVMNKALQDRLLQDPLIALSSDGSSTSFHPRGHGSFAKLIEEYVVKRKLFSLEQAIAKVTSYPASILQLKKRGQIAVGYHADLLLFNPNQVKQLATFMEPHQLAEGFDYVFVNGEIAKHPEGFSQSFGKVLTP